LSFCTGDGAHVATVWTGALPGQMEAIERMWFAKRVDGGPWVEAVDWRTEDPRTSALQRQLSEVDLWLRGKPHKLATAEEALAVQELVEAMLEGG
jgi:hypothetical protein